MKKLVFVALLALSVLPGCGKKNGDAVVATGAPVGTVYNSGGLQGSCYNMNVYSPGQAASISFQGQGWISPYTGALQASLQGANVSFPGATYTRSNSAGDAVHVYVTGQTVIAVAHLAANTVNWLKYYGTGYGQGGNICGLYIDSPVSGSTLTMSIRMISGNGSAYSITL